MLSALDRKLLRDLWRLRGQVIAIAAVIASGVAVLVMSLSTLEALDATTRAYYETYRFADIFAGVERAPNRIAEKIAALPGVQTVQTRISRFAVLDIAGVAEPILGHLVSIPERGAPTLNQLVLRSGRSVAPDRTDEVVLSEPFAEVHALEPGDHLYALINGRKRKLQVVGIALSPEFIYALGPGALMPDDKRFGILWMGRDALAAAFDLESAFNDLALSTMRGVDPRPIIARLDQILAPYGSTGAIERADQMSNWFVMNELDQLRTMSKILPSVFLAVAAFLANMVVARLVATERSEIGLMKAFGYSGWAVGWHYAKLVIAIASIGIGCGYLLGAWLGRSNTEMYAEFFRFPLLIYRPGPTAFAIGGLVSLATVLGGAFTAVRRAAAMPPAEAMRPPAPPVFRRSRDFDRSTRWLDQPTRIVLRQIGRFPLRASLTSLAAATSVGLLVMAMQWMDAIDNIARSFFHDGQRQDVVVGLADPRPTTALQDFARLPGVLSTEPMRIVGADLTVGTARHRGSLTGIVENAFLQPISDAYGRSIAVPPQGLVLGSKLAEKLGVEAGDFVRVEVLEGRRPVAELLVAAVFDTYIGMPAFLHLEALNRLLRERPSLEYVNLLVDDPQLPALFAALKELPRVSAVMLRQAAMDSFYETIGEHLMVFVSFFVAFACALGLGVAYNSARIALSERGRELATLRVLGFTRLETSYILLGEVGLLVLAGLPVGCLFGFALSAVMSAAFETELFRIPHAIEASTYGTAMVISLIATAISAALVQRRIDHLDLIEVMKTRE